MVNMINNFQELYNYANTIGCEAVMGEKMSLNTSFKTGGACGIRLSPENAEQVALIITKANELSVPFVVLGNGTNVLVPDEGIDKAVIVIGDKMASMELIGDDTISFSAGVNLVSLCRFALEKNLSGLEFALFYFHFIIETNKRQAPFGFSLSIERHDCCVAIATFN